MNQVKELRALYVLTVVAAVASVALAPSAHAAGIKQDETRLQVKMERDEFLKSHRWDHVNGEWVLKGDVMPPTGVKSREQIKTERDTFLRAHRWDREKGWVPLKQERNLSTLTRAEVKAETAQFLRTHRWDEGRDTFVSTNAALSKH
jgi:hypothetical protein